MMIWIVICISGKWGWVEAKCSSFKSEKVNSIYCCEFRLFSIQTRLFISINFVCSANKLSTWYRHTKPMGRMSRVSSTKLLILRVLLGSRCCLKVKHCLAFIWDLVTFNKTFYYVKAHWWWNVVSFSQQFLKHTCFYKTQTTKTWVKVWLFTFLLLQINTCE